VLRGFSPHAITAVPGQNVNMTLYWQAETPTAEPVSAFIHLLDEDGEIVAQTDQWPGGLPSSVWSAGQVIVDEHALAIPADLAPGDYRVATGLYTAADGTRLHAFDRAGERLPDDRFYLPAAFIVAE
jgi:hypothetical protein